MTQFICHGPLLIEPTKQAGGKVITKGTAEKFWDKYPEYRNSVGCYIYGRRAGKGITPLYIGRATKSFEQEVFAADKLNKYQVGLLQSKKGNPVIFLLCYPTKKGKTNISHITALEKFLIQQGALKNPQLLNVHHNNIPVWGITGVLRSKTKKPTKDAKAFRAMLGFA